MDTPLKDTNPYRLQPGAIPIQDFHAVNPWKNETWNLTQQMLILDEFPETAARLKGEAELTMLRFSKVSEGEANPWRKKSWDFTQQMILKAQQPELAAQLEKAAKCRESKPIPI